MKDIIIIGCGDNCRCVTNIIERINQVNPEWNIVGLVDDDEKKWGKTLGGYPIIGGTDVLGDYDEIWSICTIGNSRVKKILVERVEKNYKGVKWATIIDPSVTNFEKVEFGEGTCVATNVSFQVDIKIGKHVQILDGCIVTHDDVIGDFCTLYIGAIVAGRVNLGECCEIGMNSSIRQGCKIGDNVIIGAGAVVITDLPSDCMAIGVPAKPVSPKKTLKDIVIIGCGGFGREVAWIIERVNSVSKTWNILGFVDDDPQYAGKEIDGIPVLGNVEKLKELGEVWCACSICTGRTRRKIVEQVNAFGNVRWATIIDPSSVTHKSATIGEGSVLCVGTQINIDTKIGNHVVMIDRSAVGHDSVIGDYSILFVGATVAGNSNIGECCELGMNLSVVQGHNVGDETIVGGSALVCRDLPPKCTAVGVPAKPIKFHE